MKLRLGKEQAASLEHHLLLSGRHLASFTILSASAKYCQMFILGVAVNNEVSCTCDLALDSPSCSIFAPLNW